MIITYSPIENIDTDSNIIDTIKTIRCCNKKRLDENTIVDLWNQKTPLLEQINFLKEEHKTKNTIIQFFKENQSYFSL